VDGLRTAVQAGPGKRPTRRAGRSPLPMALLAPWLLVACGQAPEAVDPTAEGPPDGVEPLTAPSFAEAREAGRAEIRVLYVPSSGFAHQDEEGRLAGVTVELLRRFGAFVEEAHDLEVSMEFVEEPHWATFYQRVRHSRGGVFGIGNVTITEARRDELAFSPPYLSNVATLMTHSDVPELGSMDAIGEEFADLTGLSYPGTLHEERMEEVRDRHFPDMETVTVETNDELVGMAASGEGYFGYIDIYNYWRAVERGMPLRRHPVADDASEEFGVIMPRDSDWGDVMEEFFRENEGIQESDWYRALLRDHLGDELATLLLPGE